MATGSTVAYVDPSRSFDAHLIREVLKSKCLREEVDNVLLVINYGNDLLLGH